MINTKKLLKPIDKKTEAETHYLQMHSQKTDSCCIDRKKSLATEDSKASK